MKKYHLFSLVTFLVSLNSFAIDKWEVEFNIRDNSMNQRDKFGFIVVFAETQQEALSLAFQKMKLYVTENYSVEMRSILNTGPGDPHENDGFVKKVHFYIGTHNFNSL